MISIVQNGNIKYAVYKLEGGTEIDAISFEMINHHRDDKSIFAPIRLESLNGVYTELRYDIAGRIPLREFCEKNQSQQAFRNAMLSIAYALENVENYMIEFSQVLLDIDSVFINPMNYSIALLCVPIVGRNESDSIYSFFRMVVTACHVVVQPNEYSYFNSVWNVVADESAFSIANIKLALTPDQNGGVAVVGGQAGKMGPVTLDPIKPQHVVQPQSGVQLQGSVQGYEQNGPVKEEKGSLIKSLIGNKNKKQGGGLAGLKNKNSTGEAANESQVKQPMPQVQQPVQPLVQPKPGAQAPMKWPRLLRVKTNEWITINRNIFTLGRAPQRDGYCTGEENRHIGRIHAKIIVKPDGYCIVDQGSANHTWVNGEQMNKGAMKNLSEGDVIRLADEEFIFHV